MRKRNIGIAAGFLLASAALLAAPRAVATGDQVTPVFSQKLPNVPGKSLTAIVVSYPPGGKSTSHHHSGSVFAYVLSGSDLVGEFRHRAGPGVQGWGDVLRATGQHPPHQRERERDRARQPTCSLCG